MRLRLLVVPLLLCAAPAGAQSLYLQPGQHGVEASAGWSSADDTGGPEVFLSVGIAGRVDVGVGLFRYEETYDSDVTYDEIGPFVRWFLVKQGERQWPVSVALLGQAYFDEYENGDEADYYQFGPTFYRAVLLPQGLTLYPFAGFAVMTESYTEAGGAAERTTFIERDLGLHLTTRTDRPLSFGLTFIESGYNIGTYRDVRISAMLRL
ncbi:MAG TPA: hypothetical protein VFQ45_10825 [Longimicrobium sp.]|nr:hypothetical protein [Longimicrobium sp.]